MPRKFNQFSSIRATRLLYGLGQVPSSIRVRRSVICISWCIPNDIPIQFSTFSAFCFMFRNILFPSRHIYCFLFCFLVCFPVIIIIRAVFIFYRFETRELILFWKKKRVASIWWYQTLPWVYEGDGGEAVWCWFTLGWSFRRRATILKNTTS